MPSAPESNVHDRGTGGAPRAIVTGASSGIGKATAVALARAGHDLGVTWYEDEPGVEGTVQEIKDAGRQVAVRQVDLGDPEGGARIVDELADALGDGALDVFVNNAGTGHSEPFLEHGYDAWKRVLDVDLNASFLAMQAAARRMVEGSSPGGGRIIAVTSVHERVPLDGSAAYCAAKGGLALLVRVAALELAEHGITVNAVAPGETATKMTGQQDEDPRGKLRPAIPAGRPGDAHEVARAIVFLASDDAGYITGETLVVDGDMLLMAAQANVMAG